MCKNETGLTYIEHNVSCVGNKMTTFRKDNRCMIYRYHIMIGHHDFSSKIIDRSIIWDTRSAITYLMPPIGCFSDFGVCFESSWPLIGGGLCLPALRAAQAILGPRFWPRGACEGFLISNPLFSSLTLTWVGMLALNWERSKLAMSICIPSCMLSPFVLLQVIAVLCAHTSAVSARWSWTSRRR